MEKKKKEKKRKMDAGRDVLPRDSNLRPPPLPEGELYEYFPEVEALACSLPLRHGYR